jgi:3-oxoacyl-[acyl-carrier-protein] synthase-3
MDVYINAISYHLPKTIINNFDLENRFPGWSAEKVEKKIGIKQRRILSKDASVSDMAIAAAEKLFSEHSISRNDIDFILLCTQSPDYFLPTTACIIQNKLGIPTSAGAIDFNQGCSGFVYGLSLAKALVAASIANNVLLITAESYSKYIHPLDKVNLSIFGDASTACLISKQGKFKIDSFILGTDGSGAENLIVKNGAGRYPLKNGIAHFEGNDFIKSDDFLFMKGSEIFNFTMEAIPTLIKSCLTKNNVSLNDINFFILHQANSFILEHLRNKIGIDKDRFIIDMENIGNTVSSTIPIVLHRLSKKNKLNSGERIMLAGFGVGYSWGSTILTVL